MQPELAVRTVAGIVAGVAGAFVGLIVSSAIASGLDVSDLASGATRIAAICVLATAASRAGWFGTSDSTKITAVSWLASFLTAVAAAFIALWLARLTFDATDVFVLNTRIMGAGVFAAGVFANLPPLIAYVIQERKSLKSRINPVARYSDSVAPR